jgi:hypothetical protein
MAIVGLAMLIAFTLKSASLAAVKGSYLLALAVPAAVFFARGVAALPDRARSLALAISLVAALAAAATFTNRLFISTPPLGALGVAQWRAWAAKLPGSHIGEAMDLLLGAR